MPPTALNVVLCKRSYSSVLLLNLLHYTVHCFRNATYWCCLCACVTVGVLYGVYGSIYPCDVPQIGIVIAVQALLMF